MHRGRSWPLEKLPPAERSGRISRATIPTKTATERVLLVGVRSKRKSGAWTVNDSLAELEQLASTAGATVVGSMTQRVERHTHTYVGRGKLEELKRVAAEAHASTVVCDDELTPVQQRNLEESLDGIKVIDRSALILDVFARRAQTREGRLQVDLAQSEYLLPRLAGQWSHLERLGGGIGTRGPGETQIETDRRLVRERIRRLKKALEDVRRHRGLHRARRSERKMPVVSLVGYTNAGKSTLLNTLTGSGVRAENRLFSTLDPVTRRVQTPSGWAFLLTDTVGFIQRLPPTVAAAFRATLEEVQEASVIVHVVDITHQNAPAQAHVVNDILGELGLSDRPQVLALNKIDLFDSVDGLSRVDGAIEDMIGDNGSAVAISALKGTGLNRLISKAEELLSVVTAAPTVN